jgi:hypothetical protein
MEVQSEVRDRDRVSKDYQQRLLKSIERKALKENFLRPVDSEFTENILAQSRNKGQSGEKTVSYKTTMGQKLRHGEALRHQKKLEYSSPGKSPFKNGKSDLVESYMDFAVRTGIVKEGLSDLNQSPEATKSTIFLKFNVFPLGRKAIDDKKKRELIVSLTVKEHTSKPR